MEEDSIRDTSHTGMHEDASGDETLLIPAVGMILALLFFFALASMHACRFAWDIAMIPRQRQ